MSTSMYDYTEDFWAGIPKKSTVKKVVPIAVYRNGIRYVVAEAMVDVPDDIENLHELEVDITNPQLTKIKEK